jgi:hypothetical protein
MTSQFRSLFLTFLCLAVIHPTLYACSVCGCGDPLATSENSQPLAGSFRLSIESVYLTASAQSDDLMSTESVRQANLNTTLTYNPFDDWSLTIMLPVVEKYFQVSAPIGPDDGTPFGIGDMMVGARYFFLKDTDFTTKFTGLAVSGGIYFPTGGTDFTSVITEGNLDTHAQLGTGAWAFYGGLLYHRGWQDLSLVANVNYVLRTRADTTDPNSPLYQYAFGNALTGGVQVQWNVGEKLAFSLAAEGRYAESDTYMNPDFGPGIVNTPNTGGTVIDATPGIWWNLSGDSTLYARVQIPFLTNLNGIQQVDPTYIVGTQFLIR